jgi:hypothetical protein
MIERCTRPTHPRYEDYGGRGVCVDPRWLGKGGFARFLADVGERPADRTLDRIDCNGHYTPSNVKWSTLIEQRWNRRDMAERYPQAPKTSACRRRRGRSPRPSRRPMGSGRSDLHLPAAALELRLPQAVRHDVRDRRAEPSPRAVR